MIRADAERGQLGAELLILGGQLLLLVDQRGLVVVRLGGLGGLADVGEPDTGADGDGREQGKRRPGPAPPPPVPARAGRVEGQGIGGGAAARRSREWVRCMTGAGTLGGTLGGVGWDGRPRSRGRDGRCGDEGAGRRPARCRPPHQEGGDLGRAAARWAAGGGRCDAGLRQQGRGRLMGLELLGHPRRAERARGFTASSSASGLMARRVRSRSEARWAQVQKGRWGGQRQFCAATWSAFLTRVSSRE